MYVFYNLKTPVWLKNLQNKTEFKNAIWKRNILIIFSNYYTEKKKSHQMITFTSAQSLTAKVGSYFCSVLFPCPLPRKL